jgi:protein-S-isoprenylcysteine O-methyltransferase Ste14
MACASARLTVAKGSGMTITEPEPMSRAKALAYAVTLPVALLTLVFLPVGHLGWMPGWVFIGFLVATFGISALILHRVNPVIYRARSRFQPGTERWDRMLLLLMLPAMVTEIPLATLDAGRMAWSSVPPALVLLGYGLLAAGIAVTPWAQAVNRFFEPGVRLQRERGQHVITSGPYAFVRHPGYSGALMLFGGIALALGSLWALLPAAFAGAVLVLRTRWEDALLHSGLDGYADYARRVRFGSHPVSGEQTGTN